MSLVSDTFAWIDASWFEIGSSRFTLGKIAVLVGIVLALWWLAKLLERAILRLALRGSSAPQVSPGTYAFSRIARYTAWILGTLIGLNYVGLDLTSFALLSGAIGVGIGFGLQSIFSNFVSGIILLLERTLKVGDFVDLASGISGRVAEIGMRYTRITTNRAVDVIVPNSEFINNRVTNWTFDNDLRRLHIPFGVSYGSNKDAVREAAIAAANRVPGNINDRLRKPDVRLVGFGDSALNFELVAWIGPEVARSPGATTAKFFWALHDELVSRNIEIPFPQRDVHLRSGAPAPEPNRAGAERAGPDDGG
ncbi:MAG: mechanosensitive ion channel domain-containing protein [Burkholderiales bacterium]